MVVLCLVALSLGRGAGQQSASNPKIIFEEARRALVAHDYAQAERGFRAVLSIDPHSAPAYANLGVVYMRLGRYERAIEAFQNAKRLAPEERGLDLNLGLAYYHQNAFARAIPAFARVLQSNPEHAQARYLLGMSYFMNDDRVGQGDRNEDKGGGVGKEQSYESHTPLVSHKDRPIAKKNIGIGGMVCFPYEYLLISRKCASFQRAAGRPARPDRRDCRAEGVQAR